MSTGLVYSKRYLEHEPSRFHPETPERLKAILRALKEGKLWNEGGTKVFEPSPALRKDIELIHKPEYVAKVERLSKSGRMLDLDTPTDEKTFELALLAAGGTIDAGDPVTKGEVKNAFALVRPPGHHASRGAGGGFCYFNNIAIMIEKLRQEGQIGRAMIFDIDSHHGNGTQDIFYEDGDVLYLSFHQDGHTLYPGTGFSNEVGSGPGEGYTVNVPFPPESSDEDYACALEEIFVPLTVAFEPDIIAVSIGFDAHASDPLTRLQLSSNAYGWLVGSVVEQARAVCKGKTVFVLEGGYATEIIGEAAVNVVRGLVGEKTPKHPKGRSSTAIENAKKELSEYWDF